MARVEEYNEKMLWKPGQLFSVLLEAEERMQEAMSCFYSARLDSGENVVIYNPKTGEKYPLWGSDLEAPFLWFLNELQKPLTQRFTQGSW
jgi:hypothetical protein